MKTYRQKRGAAIGTKFVLLYSILFRSDFEDKLLENFDLKAHVWWRYIFFICQHGKKTLNAFIEIIKFTAEYLEKYIQSLDMTINIENEILKTDFFVKPADKNQCFESFSCHPFHCKKDIAYSRVLRLNRICSIFLLARDTIRKVNLDKGGIVKN